MRRPVVAVFGSGEPDVPTRDLAEQAGASIAKQGWHLLTGGGRGVMEAATRGFCAVCPREGLALGILPQGGFLNEEVELPIFTPLTADPREPLNRNWVNVRTAWGALVLWGGAGTAQELALCGELHTPCQTVDSLDQLEPAVVWLAAHLRDPAIR